MSPNAEIDYKKNPNSKERIFFLCEDCMWGVTCLDKPRLFEVIGEQGICPMCHQDQLSSFPLMLNDSITYRYSEKTGIEVKFNNRRPIKQISQMELA
jgi:hypothetical protein